MDQKHAIAALGALAQETRLALFRLLVTCGPAGLPAGVIAERLGVQPWSLSFHMAQLVHAGLITQRRLSRQLIYSAEYGAMNALLAYLYSFSEHPSPLQDGLVQTRPKLTDGGVQVRI